MKLQSLTMRGALALALASLIGAAMADSNTTEIKLLGKDKKLETLKFEGELPIGESRGLYTDAGTAVTVQRTEQGLRIETPERSIDVPYPNADEQVVGGASNVMIHGDGQNKRVIVMHGDKDHAMHKGAEMHKRHVIVLNDGEGGGESADADVDAALKQLAELEDLDAIDVEGANSDKKVVVIRKVEKRSVD
jgi:hypothetical protein